MRLRIGLSNNQIYYYPEKGHFPKDTKIQPAAIIVKVKGKRSQDFREVEMRTILLGDLPFDKVKVPKGARKQKAVVISTPKKMAKVEVVEIVTIAFPSEVEFVEEEE